MSDESVDFGWVMEVTFIVTVLLGAPIVALGGLWFEIEGWNARIIFATTVAAAVWFITAIGVYAYARSSVSAR